MAPADDVDGYVNGLLDGACDAAPRMAAATTAQKNRALQEIANLIRQREAEILAANAADVKAAVDAGLESALVDRLELTGQRVGAMADGVMEVAELPDPVGQMSDFQYRPSGIQVGRMRVPLGVIGIIFESRPNVTADAAALCLKSGNAAILRGGSEARQSNAAIGECVTAGLTAADLPAGGVQVVAVTDRQVVGAMLGRDDAIDMIVPRGGKGLIERVSREARMPVLKHLDGVCHVFLDDDADVDKAHAVALNAKTQRYGTCNTMETLLATPAMAEKVLPRLVRDYQAAGVELRGCERTRGLCAEVGVATEEDWYEEYLAPVLAIRIVDDVEQAIEHIRQYGSKHTDTIVTENFTRARHFLSAVDSSTVMVNASTRFADGFEFGLGAEIGISTDKFHARGPVGLEGLTSEKWIVLGDGHIRE